MVAAEFQVMGAAWTWGACVAMVIIEAASSRSRPVCECRERKKAFMDSGFSKAVSHGTSETSARRNPLDEPETGVLRRKVR